MKNNFITKIIGATLAFAMMIGGAVGIFNAQEAKEANAAGSSEWTQVTSLSGLNTTDSYVIANNADKGNYFNGSVSNGHLQTSAFSASLPASSTAAGVFKLEAINAGNNIYKIKLVSTSKYVDASKAGSGGCRIGQASDANGWRFLLSGTNFNAIYQKNYSNKYAALRCYNNTSFRSYSNDDADQISTSSGTVFRIYKYQANRALTGLNIASGENSVRKSYDAGDSFDPTGLVINAEWDNTLDTEANVVDAVVWTPTQLTANTTTVTGTYTSGTQTATVTVSGLTVTAPDATIDGDENAPAGLGTDTSTTATGEGQINSTGVNYGYHGLAIYSSSNNLEFNKEVSNAYIGNNESYGKFIRKIRVTLLYKSNFEKLTMYKGDAMIPGTTVVANGGGEASRAYDFGDDAEYFALKQTTTGSWIQIVSIDIFLGSTAPVIDTVTATTANRTYYAGTQLSSSDFSLTVNWTAGKAATNPTEGYTWTVNSVANGELQEGNNTVVVTYGGVSSEPINIYAVPQNASMYLNNSESVMSISGTEVITPTSESQTEVATFSTMGLANETLVENISIGSVTLNGDAGSNTNAPKYYTSGTAIRVYQGNTLEFSVTGNITKIEFTVSQGTFSDISANVGDMDNENTCWDGEASTVTFTHNGSSQIRFSSISVTYYEGELSVNDVKLRFGASIPVADWTAINEHEGWEITDYGVMLYKTKAQYAETAPTVQTRYAANHSYVAVFNKGSGVAPTAEDSKYTFTARIDYTQDNEYTKYIIAQAFIVVNGTDYHFVGEEMRGSVRSLASTANVNTNLSSGALTYLTTAGQ